MSGDGSGERRTPTRRDLLRYGAVAATAGALAGCSSGGESTDTATPTATETESTGGAAEPTDTPSATPTATDTATDAATTTDGSYSASISPVGEVTFDDPPQSVFALMQHHAEMALLLGRGDDVNAVYAPGYVDSLLNALTPRLDGVTVDWADLTRSWGIGKESVYDLDSDVHLADPARMVTMDGWDASAVADVRENVAPWFGNNYSATHETPPSPYADGYEYYTLWEIFERVAAVFREQDRYETLADERSKLLDHIESNRPPESERPSAAMVLLSTNGDGMWAYRMNEPGYYAAHSRPLGATDAMAEAGVETGAKVDHETLLDADPEVLIVLGGIVDWHDMPAIRENLSDDPVASGVTAVDEGRVHAQATRHQGPLVNLFQLEMGAKQLYPDQFGEWPTYESGPYPELDESDRLLDYQRVADTITSE